VSALAAAAPRGRPRRLLAAIGDATLGALRAAARLAGFAAAILGHALRPRTWRRTVRAQFERELREAGVRALPAVFAAAALIGVGLVAQGLYWLQAAGQTGLIGSILRTVLIREIAPIMVGLILVGRSGIVALIEIGGLRAGGQLRMLETQGVDPFHLLVVPRVAATAVAGFALTVAFVAASLAAGFVAASLIETLQISLAEFADRVVAGLGPGTFALVALKSLGIGFAAATVCCFSALDARGDPARAVPGGFMRALLAVLAVNGAVSAVL
jgi:phospholipid/cholesterol/gamma-HCH transport system permease protein